MSTTVVSNVNPLRDPSVEEMLREIEAIRFYGSLEIKFEAGHVVLIRKSETFKPTQAGHGNNRGKQDEQRS